MTGLMEQPVLIGLMAIAVVAFLVVAWLKTGESKFLVGSGIAVVAFGLLIAVERFVKTDRERARETLYAIADAVKNNELESALSYIHSGKSGMKFQVRSRLRNQKFHDARITNIRSLVVQNVSGEPVARAEFTARANLDIGSGTINIVRFLEVQMKMEEDQWKVWNYEDHDFQDAFRTKSAN